MSVIMQRSIDVGVAQGISQIATGLDDARGFRADEQSPVRVREYSGKRLLDFVGSALIILAAAPLLAFIALAVRRDGGPVLFGHMRVGRDGKLFRCLKFRSMVTDSERRLSDHLRQDESARREWETTFKLKNDPRITAVGRFLRRTSLDELPQLFNVLRGEMSLVGPRPVVKAELERYGVHQITYTSVRPGMTGLWQVSGRSDTSYAQRVRLDVDYVSQQSFRTDISILVRTVAVVAASRGAY